jgi:hypothetical protein
VGAVPEGANRVIFIRGILGGLVAAVVMWSIVVCFYAWRWHQIMKQQGLTGLTAHAGGWNYLLHLPSVVILLTVAFGIGLYLRVR